MQSNIYSYLTVIDELLFSCWTVIAQLLESFCVIIGSFFFFFIGSFFCNYWKFIAELLDSYFVFDSYWTVTLYLTVIGQLFVELTVLAALLCSFLAVNV